jgi:hypothetical protein
LILKQEEEVCFLKKDYLAAKSLFEKNHRVNPLSNPLILSFSSRNMTFPEKLRKKFPWIEKYLDNDKDSDSDEDIPDPEEEQPQSVTQSSSKGGRGRKPKPKKSDENLRVVKEWWEKTGQQRYMTNDRKRFEKQKVHNKFEKESGYEIYEGQFWVHLKSLVTAEEKGRRRLVKFTAKPLEEEADMDRRLRTERRPIPRRTSPTRPSPMKRMKKTIVIT